MRAALTSEIQRVTSTQVGGADLNDFEWSKMPAPLIIKAQSQTPSSS